MLSYLPAPYSRPTAPTRDSRHSPDAFVRPRMIRIEPILDNTIVQFVHHIGVFTMD